MLRSARGCQTWSFIFLTFWHHLSFDYAKRLSLFSNADVCLAHLVPLLMTVSTDSAAWITGIAREIGCSSFSCQNQELSCLNSRWLHTKPHIVIGINDLFVVMFHKLWSVILMIYKISLGRPIDHMGHQWCWQQETGQWDDVGIFCAVRDNQTMYWRLGLHHQFWLINPVRVRRRHRKSAFHAEFGLKSTKELVITLVDVVA
jgi:hypothetical protein